MMETMQPKQDNAVTAIPSEPEACMVAGAGPQSNGSKATLMALPAAVAAPATVTSTEPEAAKAAGLQSSGGKATLMALPPATAAAAGGGSRGSNATIEATKPAARTAIGGTKAVLMAAEPRKGPQPLTHAEFEALQDRLDRLTDAQIDKLMAIVGETEAVSDGTGDAEVELDLKALPAEKQRAVFDFVDQALSATSAPLKSGSPCEVEYAEPSLPTPGSDTMLNRTDEVLGMIDTM